MTRIPPYIGWPLLGVWTYGALYYWANRMAPFFPARFPEGFWDAGPKLGARDVWLDTADGARLHAWWIEQPGARLVTLYAHGNAGNLSHRAHVIPEITAAGSSLLLLDYRGYGRSKGRPSEKGLYADADAAYRHLTGAGWRPEQIVAHGESLGSAVAVELASRQRCAGVVLEAPFSSGKDMAARVLPLLGPLLVWGFDSTRKIPGIRAPLLVIHGDRDQVVPFEQGRKLFEAAGEPKWFWALAGAGHNNLIDAAGAQYRERLREFYSRL